jgi:transitional endoplasmic reticulum ATPase
MNAVHTSSVNVLVPDWRATSRGLVDALHEAFTCVADLEHVDVLIDELEEITARRDGPSPQPLQRIPNELLRIIPAIRERPDRLPVCAVNSIRALDPSFWRHDCFDDVLPSVAGRVCPADDPSVLLTVAVRVCLDLG